MNYVCLFQLELDFAQIYPDKDLIFLYNFAVFFEKLRKKETKKEVSHLKFSEDDSPGAFSNSFTKQKHI